MGASPTEKTLLVGKLFFPDVPPIGGASLCNAATQHLCPFLKCPSFCLLGQGIISTATKPQPPLSL